MQTLYEVNAPSVSSENIDGEVIIVNLETGSYYSTVDVGAYIWARITAREPRETIVASLVDAYSDSRAAIEGAVAGFIERLENERLVSKCDEAAPAARTAAGQVVDAGLPARFSTPLLNCYSDMQDMLLLDPVHDVADVGWPAVKPE